MDGLLELLPVRCELLDARFTLQVPQADGRVVTCREQQLSPSFEAQRGSIFVQLRGNGGSPGREESCYLLPDIRYSPLGSTAKLVTASR